MTNIGYFIIGLTIGLFDGYLLFDSIHKLIEVIALKRGKKEFENWKLENEKGENDGT